MKNKNFLKSFKHAADGIITACREERNIRFHIAAVLSVFVFAAFYGLSRAEWAILVLTVISVISAELVNTAIERAVDTATEDIKLSAKIAKDAAAGAVLIAAAGAVCVGVCLFGNIKKIKHTLILIFTNPKNIGLCVTVLILYIGFLTIIKKRKIK